MSTLAIRPKPMLLAPFKRLIARHPFFTFFALAFGGTWLLDLPIVLGQDGLGLLPYHMPFALYAAIFLAGSYAGPTLAALLVTAALEGKTGVHHFLRRYVQWRVGVRWYLIILVGYPLFFLGLVSLGLGRVPVQALRTHWSTLFTLYLPALLIFPAIINWGEEAGWRGFAQTRLQSEYGALKTSLLVGFFHGVWHLPVFLLVEGPAAMGPLQPWVFARNTLDIMLITIIWTWIFNRTQGSILIASLSHATWNAAQAWVGTLVPNLPKQFGPISLNDAATLIFLVCALLVIVATKGRLGYQPVDPRQANK
ncbi:MAG: CPBP family intramembrane glutamic endopeptidase [Caldilineaceae bacterium]